MRRDLTGKDGGQNRKVTRGGTCRLSLDQIRSAHSRRERSHDAAAIEFAAPPERAALTDPADRVTFDDGVRLALLVVLQELSPAERVVFVLHDIFQVPFATVAATVGRTVPSCRQLARRARQKISARQPRFDVAAAEHEIRFWGPGATLVSYPGGQPAILGFRGRQLAGILVLTMGDEVTIRRPASFLPVPPADPVGAARGHRPARAPQTERRSCSTSRSLSAAPVPAARPTW